MYNEIAERLHGNATDIANCMSGSLSHKKEIRRGVLRLMLISIKGAKADPSLKEAIEELLINDD